MSENSDAYERKIASAINAIPGVKATRPSVGPEYSDVKITQFNGKSTVVWLEVKMNHTDNLANPRVFYQDGAWRTTYKTPAAGNAVELLNESDDAKKFIRDIAKYTGIPKRSLIVPTTIGMLGEEGAVPLRTMREYVEQPGHDRYIIKVEDLNLGEIITNHYIKGKREPAHYMQAGDDFYMISNKNPLGLARSIPLLSGRGNFNMRVSTRTNFYEVQAELKIKSMPDSGYSVMPGTKKLNPFTAGMQGIKK